MNPQLIAAGMQAGSGIIQTGLDMISGGAMSRRQERSARRLAKYQHDRNYDMLMTQLNWNSPVQQRKRMEDAGFNPNAIFDQVTPGNMEATPRYPDIQNPDFSYLGNLGSRLMEGRLMAAQTDLLNTKNAESGVKQELAKAQTALAKANPYMNKAYVDSMVTTMEATARMKEQQRNFMLSYPEGTDVSRGMQKMQQELDLLVQRFKLGDADAKIKAQIITGKEFQNAISEIQKKWMADGEITPQHIYMGIMLLLQKLM